MIRKLLVGSGIAGRMQPILFISAMVNPTDRKCLMAARADEVLVKPPDTDRFL